MTPQPAGGDGPGGPMLPGGESDLHLKYYMFDWDDNILRMPTRIHLERRTAGGWEPYDVSTAEFARIRRDTVNYRPRQDNWDAAFVDFYDVGARGDQAFLEDVKMALTPVLAGVEPPAPSYEKFKRALIEGRLFAIITARSHGSAAILKGVRWFIEHALSAPQRAEMIGNLRSYMRYFGEQDEPLDDHQVLERYLVLNHYRGVTSPEFQQLMGRKTAGSESPEQAKQFAIREFVHHVVGLIGQRGAHLPVSIGFSDDDVHNVQSVEHFLKEELAERFPLIRFVVYDTSDPLRAGSRKVLIEPERGHA